MKMALREITAQEFECDGCGKTFLIEKDQEMPDGFHGDVSWIGVHGGRTAEWYACQERCIRKAVTQSLQHDNELPI